MTGKAGSKRKLTRIKFRIETRGQGFVGDVRLRPEGWERALADEHGRYFYHAGTVGGALLPSPCHAIRTLLDDLGRMQGWEPHGPVTIW
jgi:hypothetical protein